MYFSDPQTVYLDKQGTPHIIDNIGNLYQVELNGIADPVVLDVETINGLGKFKIKKVFKKIGKVVKKVAPVAAGLYFAPTITASLLAKRQQAKTAAKAETEYVEPTAPQPYSTAPQPYPTAPQPYPTAPQPYPTAPQPYPMAPQYSVPQVIYNKGAVDYPGVERQPQPQSQPQPQAGTGLPSWVLPVALGAGALLLAMRS